MGSMKKETDTQHAALMIAAHVQDGVHPNKLEEILKEHPVYFLCFEDLKHKTIDALKSRIYLGRDFETRMKEFGPNFLYLAQ